MRFQPTVSQDTGGRLFVLSVEHVIAYARLALALFALAAISVDPSQPVQYTGATYGVLTAYHFYATVVLLIVLARRMSRFAQFATHLIDIAAIMVLMHFTDGPTSPFFGFVVFPLLAASLRWDWRCTLATAVLQAQMVLFLGLITSGGRALLAPDEINRLVIRTTSLLVAGGVLAYVNFILAQGRERVAKLAAWPVEPEQVEEDPPLCAPVGHAAGVLEAQRMLVVWEQGGEPDRHLWLWRNGQCTHARERPHGALAALVAPQLEEIAFIARQADALCVRSADGRVNLEAPAIAEDLRERFAMGGVVSASFAGANCSGRVFALDCASLGEDLLPLVEIVAERISIELARHALRRQIESAAQARERTRVAHDLHDGLLQGLTAAQLHLKKCTEAARGKLRAQLGDVSDILLTEQRRVRAFVDQLHPRRNGAPVSLFADGRYLLSQLGHYWHCETPLNVTPADAHVPAELAEQLHLILAEAVGNAARHGRATSVAVEFECNGSALGIRISDNGAGFPNLVGTYDDDALSGRDDGPASLCARIKGLGGQITLNTSPAGSQLQIMLPVS